MLVARSSVLGSGRALAEAPEKLESAALISAGGDDRLRGRWSRRALRHLRDALAARDITVKERRSVQRYQRRRASGPCENTACAAEMARNLGVSAVAALSLWSDVKGKEPKAIALSLVMADGRQLAGDAVVKTPKALRSAVDAALSGALAKQQTGETQVLEISGTPVGALVVIDGTEDGVLPYRRSLPAGKHTVEVRLDGYESATRELEIGARTGAVLPIHVSLKPVLAGAPTRKQTRSPAAFTETVDAPSAWPHYLGAATLGTAGIAGITVGVLGLGADSCELASADGSCLVGTRSQKGASIGWIAGGAAALVAGSTWLTLKLLRDKKRRTQTALELQPAGLRLRHDF